MSDFPSGVAPPEGAQKFVDVCKGTWAVISDEDSAVETHNKAIESYEAAVSELNDLGVHVNCEGNFPLFTLCIKERDYNPSDRVAAAPFLKHD
jgi:hypothetical protein